jgi:hypothetical protein
MSEMFRLLYGCMFVCGLCLLVGIAEWCVAKLEGKKSTPQVVVDARARAAERVRRESLKI